MKNRERKTVSHKKTTINTKKRVTGGVRGTSKSVKLKEQKKKIRFITVINYTFLASLLLTIIFGVQTDVNKFFTPFVIVLVITIVCMGIILVNAVYSKVKKIMNKNKKI